MWCWKSLQAPTATPALQIKVSKAPGAKCERCWNYSTHVGEDTGVPDGVRALQRGACRDRGHSRRSIELVGALIPEGRELRLTYA